MSVMEPLYLYEAYCMLSNQKRQALDPNDKSSKLTNKELRFGAYLMLDGYIDSQRVMFATGKLVDRSPGDTPNESADIKISSSGLKAIKEGDLLILAKSDLAEGADDVKQKMTPGWLKEKVN